MSRHRIGIGAAAIVIVVLLVVAIAGAVVPGGTPKAAAADPIVLTVTHEGAVVKTYTLADVQALTAYSGYAGFITTGGTVNGPDPVTGVSLVTVLQDAGLTMTSAQSLDVHAPDGFGGTFGYDMVVNGAPYGMFNATTKAAENAKEPLAAILVYLRGGVALPPFDVAHPDGDGPLRFYMAQADDMNQIMEGSDSVKGVSILNLRDEPVTDWKLKLVGLKIKGTRQVATENRLAIQTCATPNCHKSGWSGQSAQAWTGVPLWRLIGVVDGGARHKGHSYNAALARRGYRIRLYNAAGKYVTIGSKGTVYRDRIIMANQLNGAALDTKYAPLRLVGPAKYVPGSKRLGCIVKIVMLPKLK
jgi:DMSO/TMAO reductase YedYZ molybdopterin-dependent catalytic subunit